MCSSDLDDLLGAAWLPHDGKVIPGEVPVALAKAARARGARVCEGVRVLELLHRDGRVCGVRTSAGDIRAEYVVLTGGMWTRELARVLKELARIGFADIRKLFNEDGSLKRFQDMDDDSAAALSGVQTLLCWRGTHSPQS